MEELSALYPKKVLHDVYRAVITDQEYSFWCILLTAKEEEVLLRAYCMARRMVESEQRVHGILVGHFLTAGTLTEAHFKRFFGSRAFLRVRSISGRLFL